MSAADGPSHEMHVASGGVWRFMMHGPDGKDYPNRITFVEVDPPRRLVYEHGSDDDDDRTHDFHVTVTFDEDGGGTLLAMRARFPSVEARRLVVENVHAVEGAGQTVDRLAAHVEEMRRLTGPA